MNMVNKLDFQRRRRRLKIRHQLQFKSLLNSFFERLRNAN